MKSKSYKFLLNLQNHSVLTFQLAMRRNELLIALVLIAGATKLAFVSGGCSIPKLEYPIPMRDDYNKTVKSLCFINKPDTYFGSLQYCKTRSMNLMVLNNLFEQTTFNNLIGDLFGEDDPMVFRIDGLWFNNQWKTVNGTGPALASGLQWWKGSTAWCNGDSAAVTNVAWPMMKLFPQRLYLDGFTKTMKMYYFCEYKA